MSEKPQKAHKIVRFESENVKRIKAVSIRPDGNIVEITGENGNGKSSILDSIWYTLGGTNGTKQVPSKPIRKGEKKAVTEIELNGITVRRTFNLQEDGSYTTAVVVETDEGMRAQKPQELLNKLIGELTFDPLEFVRMEAKDQFDILKTFVPDFDFDAEAKTRKSLFDERTDVNRRTRELKAQAAGIVVPEDTPDEETDVNDLADELQKIGEENIQLERRAANRKAAAEEADRLEGEAESLLEHAAELRRQADQAEGEADAKHGKAKELREKIESAGPLPEPKDTAEVREKMVVAQKVNEQVRLKKSKADLEAKAAESEKRADELTASIAESDERKRKAVAEAKMPVDGISFGDEEILLNDLPFNQASSAEQLRAAVGLTIAGNQRLRVVLIKDGSLLDHKSFAILEEMAEANDFQVWVEVVESNRPGAIIIEDGMIKKPEGAEAAE